MIQAGQVNNLYLLYIISTNLNVHKTLCNCMLWGVSKIYSVKITDTFNYEFQWQEIVFTHHALVKFFIHLHVFFVI